MLVLVDTNILVRAVQRSHPMSRTAIDALKRLHNDGSTLCLTPQNVMEFWNVCTRPVDVNGMGFSIKATDRFAQRLDRIFALLPDSLQTYRAWRDIVSKYGVSGSKVHDARLVAAMSVNRVAKILTFNVDDFSRYGEIEAVHPRAIVH